jgi:hypothetical protein
MQTSGLQACARLPMSVSTECRWREGLQPWGMPLEPLTTENNGSTAWPSYCSIHPVGQHGKQHCTALHSLGLIMRALQHDASANTYEHDLLVGGTPTDRMRMASGALSSGCVAGGGGGPRRGCRRRNSCAGVCPKWLIWSSMACAHHHRAALPGHLLRDQSIKLGARGTCGVFKENVGTCNVSDVPPCAAGGPGWRPGPRCPRR